MRRIGAAALAIIAFALGGLATARRSVEDRTLIFQYAPLHLVPDGLQKQVEVVRAVVPAGSNILYLTDKIEPWQLVMWRRCLYPGYMLIPVEGVDWLRTPEFRQLRQQMNIQYAISTSAKPLDPGLRDMMALPFYSNDFRALLGKLPAAP